MVEEACKDLSGVSASQVEMQSGIQFYDGITTDEIQEILIRSASDLIDLDHPNYQFVAARLLLSCLRKEAFHKNIWKEGMPSVFDVTAYNATINKVYDDEGELRPNASPELSKISKLINSKNKELDKVFGSLASVLKQKDMLKKQAGHALK